MLDFQQIIHDLCRMADKLRTRALAIVFLCARLRLISRFGGGAAEQFAADDGTVFRAVALREFLDQVIVVALCVGVLGIAVAFEQSQHHGRAAHGAADLAHPAQSSAEGGSQPCRRVLLQAREVGKRQQHRLCAVEAVEKVSFSQISVCHIKVPFRF